MSKDYVVTLEVDTDLLMRAIVTCQGDDFDEDKITHILLFDICQTQRGGEIWLRRKMTLKQFEKWSGNWKIKSVEGDSLTDFLETISSVIRPWQDKWKPTKELTVDDFEPADE